MYVSDKNACFQIKQTAIDDEISIFACREKVVVNKTKVSLVGTSATSTIVTWSAPWIHTTPFEIPLYVQASDFVAKHITFQVCMHA